MVAAVCVNGTFDDILSRALGVETQHMNLSHQRRVGKIMRVLGWERKSKKINGRVIKAFFKPSTAKTLTSTATQPLVVEPSTSKNLPSTLSSTLETLSESTIQPLVDEVDGNNEVWSTFSEDENEKVFNFGSEKVLGNEPVFSSTPSTQAQNPYIPSISTLDGKVGDKNQQPSTSNSTSQNPCTAGISAVDGNCLPDMDIPKKKLEEQSLTNEMAYSEERKQKENNLVADFRAYDSNTIESFLFYLRIGDVPKESPKE